VLNSFTKVDDLAKFGYKLKKMKIKILKQLS
jgi:hypothetical protein